jgi:hypothetical protein
MLMYAGFPILFRSGATTECQRVLKLLLCHISTISGKNNMVFERASPGWDSARQSRKDPPRLMTTQVTQPREAAQPSTSGHR